MRASLVLFFLVEPLILRAGRLTAAPYSGDFCTFPRDAGSCAESLQRFFFNASSWQCQPFVYRGCRGNVNRFITREECERSCGTIEKPGSCPPSPPGLLTECLADCSHDGNCPEAQKCCSYGCALRCTDPIQDICRLPPEPGPCDADLRSWFYDWQAHACKRFTYGGCLGNRNRFTTHKACKHQCARPRTRPSLPPTDFLKTPDQTSLE
ncbi:hypothetical protein lerEdw1_014766 [Lerista edwardsae]|nr:hypothetical protein lerEdw1_014768 [Lerista edwardsae]KAJ6625917.1 hypothetical protein lerEdw1_014766 [Lerista edwardsae]